MSHKHECLLSVFCSFGKLLGSLLHFVLVLFLSRIAVIAQRNPKTIPLTDIQLLAFEQLPAYDDATQVNLLPGKDG